MRANLRIPQKRTSAKVASLCCLAGITNIVPKYSQKNNIFKIVKSTLQNKEKLHYIVKKFAYIKKKQYLCSRFLKQHL